MKFTDGMWKVKEGVTLNWMSNVERSNIKDNEVDLLLTKPVHNRGDKLNYPTISASIRSPIEGVVAVKFTHWEGEEDTGPLFALHETKPQVAIQEEKNKHLTFRTDPLCLEVNTAPNELSFRYSDARGKLLTGNSFRSIALATTKDSPRYDPRDELYAEEDNYILVELDLSVHEKIYGLGERFGPFIKNGQQVDIWNEDGGTSSQLTYKNVPFYISSRGYGVFVNNCGRVMLELQSERTTRVNIAVKAESLEYMVIAGSSPKDILDRYTALTGRPSLPPAWSYGLWLTTSFTTSYDEATVTGFLDGFKKRSIPLGVFHFDAFWMKSYQWCDFKFDDDYFTDAVGYLKRLKARGFRLCVWMNPYVAQASPLFAEGKKNNYFIMRADTPRPTVWQWDLWQPGMAVVDFTNPAARTWFASHLNKLMDMGIDSFKTDFGERIPFSPARVKHYDGSDPLGMHNFYAYLYNKTVWETMQAHPSCESPCLFARSATTGCQSFPVHWGGDCESTFPAMAETLRGGLSLALSGFAFWAHDIGGFEGLPAPALYKRWVQFGLLSSHSRLHGSSSYRVPWIYEDKAEADACSKILQEAVRRKLSLMPYLLRTALEAKLHGTPVMRAMFLEFDNDLNVWQLDTQYMLGAELLVAPVFSEDGEVHFYVPKSNHDDATKGTYAKWRSWFDHSKTYEEGNWYMEKHPYETMPLLVRPGAVIPMNPSLEAADGDFVQKGLQVLVNGPLEKGRQVELVEAGQTAKVTKTFYVSPGEQSEVINVRAEGFEVEVVNMSQ